MMKSSEYFEAFARRLAAPFAFVIGVSAALTKMFEQQSKQGLLILAISSFLSAIIYLTYTFIAKDESK